MTIFYIPLTVTLLSALNCKSMSCPEGYEFPDKETRLASRKEFISFADLTRGASLVSRSGNV